jgi:hypothetical protein
MGQLVLLVVAAAWAAVLIPPLLRSRIENRPNSSVSDFRRQLNRLQSSVPARAGGSMRPVGRPLAPSPLYRQAATGRPGVRTASRQAPGHLSPAAHYSPARGDHSGAMRRHSDVAMRRMSPAAERRRRRTNVLFSLVMLSGSTLFLAATTKATLMLYLFAISFLALCGYIYLLAQIRQRNHPGSHFSW